MQDMMTESDAAKVDANAKADAPDASDAFDASKIPTPKINVNRGIRKPFAVEKLLSLCMSLRQQALWDAHSADEGADTGKFVAAIDAKKEAEKEATKADARRKADAISTSISLFLRQKGLRETHNYGLGGG